MRIISAKYCLGWTVLVATAILATTYYQMIEFTPNILIVLIIFLAYGVQGLLAEVLGVSVREQGMSFPRRILSNPFLVLWRQRIDSSDIDRIGSLPENGVRVFRKSSGRPEFGFSNHDQKALFLKISKQMYPTATVFRDS